MTETEMALPTGSPLLPPRVMVRPAASREELQESFALVYRSYLRLGYVGYNPAGMRLSVYNAFPDAVTLVGVLRGQVIACVTIVPDTPIGLPMDDIYHPEVQALRESGRKVAEVTMFADRRSEIRRSLPMLLSLMKRVFDYATLVLKVNDLCITINPRHDLFYTRYLLFEHLGGLRTYPSVQNNPALARRLDLDRVWQACQDSKRLLEHFFDDRTPVDVFHSRYRLTCGDLQALFVEKAQILQAAPEPAIRALRKHYPDCPWDGWVRLDRE